MENNAGSYTLEGTSILLWVAIGIGILFIGILVFDFIRRRRRENRFRDYLVEPRRNFFIELRDAIRHLRRHSRERKKWDDSDRRPRRPK